MTPSTKRPRAPRTRAPRACRHCHERKVRCDVTRRQGPCNNCILDNKPCELMARKPRRTQFKYGIMLDTSQLPRDVELSRWNPTPIDQPCACKSQGQSKDCTSETETSPFFQTLSPIPRTQATTEDATTENLTQEAVHDNQPAHAHGSKYIPVFDETEPSLEEQLPEINKPDLEGLLPPDTFALDSEDDLNLHDPMAQHFRSPPDFDIEVLLDILEAGEASNEGSHRTESSSSVDESNFQDGLPTFEDHVRRDCLGLFGSLIPAL